jgi:putative iron-dependent peroxidase
MLTNMFIGDPPGNTDRILDFSTAVTGSLFFAPTADFLDDPPDPPGAGASAASAPAVLPDASGPATDNGSLGIGSLKRSTT